MSPWTGRVSDSLSNKKHCPQAADLSAENSHSLIKTMASYFPSDHWNPASKTKSALFCHAKPYKNKMYNLTNKALSMISIIYRSNNQSYVNSCDIVLVHKDVNRLNDPTFQNRLTRSHYTPEARVQIPPATCVTFDISAFPRGISCVYLWWNLTFDSQLKDITIARVQARVNLLYIAQQTHSSEHRNISERASEKVKPPLSRVIREFSGL